MSPEALVAPTGMTPLQFPGEVMPAPVLPAAPMSTTPALTALAVALPSAALQAQGTSQPRLMLTTTRPYCAVPVMAAARLREPMMAASSVTQAPEQSAVTMATTAMEARMTPHATPAIIVPLLPRAAAMPATRVAWLQATSRGSASTVSLPVPTA